MNVESEKNLENEIIHIADLMNVPRDIIENLNLGNKILNLLFLIKNGFSQQVPKFLIIPSKIVDEIQVKRKLDKLLINKISNLFDDVAVNNIIIRSSALIEDMDDIPSAGLFESIPIGNHDNIEKSIISCADSANSNRVKSIIGKKPPLSIIVQELIFPKISGVLFSKDPVSNDESLVVIESSFGSCGTVVSGKYPVDLYKIRKDPFRDDLKINTMLDISKFVEIQNIARKSSYLSPISNKSIKISEDKACKPSLTFPQLKQLMKISIKIEKIFKKTIDLEWGFDNEDKLWLFQLRSAH